MEQGSEPVSKKAKNDVAGAAEQSVAAEAPVVASKKSRVVKPPVDPVNGVKFDHVDLSDPQQVETIIFRGKQYSEIVRRNDREDRKKNAVNQGFWEEERCEAYVPNPVGSVVKAVGYHRKGENERKEKRKKKREREH